MSFKSTEPQTHANKTISAAKGLDPSSDSTSWDQKYIVVGTTKAVQM